MKLKYHKSDHKRVWAVLNKYLFLPLIQYLYIFEMHFKHQYYFLPMAIHFETHRVIIMISNYLSFSEEKYILWLQSKIKQKLDVYYVHICTCAFSRDSLLRSVGVTTFKIQFTLLNFTLFKILSNFRISNYLHIPQISVE